MLRLAGSAVKRGRVGGDAIRGEENSEDSVQLGMKRLFAVGGFALLVFGASFRVHAMAGELSSPSLAFPAAFPQESRTRVIAILGDPECKFLGGHFINADTTLEYGGKTAALNRLLEKLSQCDGIQVHLAFSGGRAAAWTLSNGSTNASWTVRHNGWADAGWIEIQVNTSSGLIELGLLEIPAFGKAVASASATTARPEAKPK
jgi:hypothetical protein